MREVKVQCSVPAKENERAKAKELVTLSYEACNLDYRMRMDHCWAFLLRNFHSLVSFITPQKQYFVGRSHQQGAKNRNFLKA